MVAIDTVSQSELNAPNVSPPALRVSHVSVRLGDRLALRDVDFEIAAGSLVGLIGPTGSGKSTLIRASLGVLPVANGSIEIEGRPISASRDRFGFLPQRQHLDLDMPLRTRDVVMMGRLRHSGWFKPPSKADREIVDWALEQVKLSDRRNSSIGEMSFGQQQRVFFARALAQEGALLFLDEPMNGVDPTTQELFLDLLGRLHERGTTIIMATHDLNQAACVCDYLCVLNQSLVAYGAVGATLTDEVLQKAYGGHIHFLQPSTPDTLGHVQVLEDLHHHDAHDAHSDHLHNARLA